MVTTAEAMEYGIHAIASQIDPNDKTSAQQCTVFTHYQIMQKAFDEFVNFRGEHVLERTHELLLEILYRDEGDKREKQDDGGKEGEKELEGDGRSTCDQVAFGKGKEEEPRNAEQIESFEARQNYP